MFGIAASASYNVGMSSKFHHAPITIVANVHSRISCSGMLKAIANIFIASLIISETLSSVFRQRWRLIKKTEIS